MSGRSWEDVLKEHFPAYLLPGGVLGPLSREAAARFLERIGGRPDLLDLLLAASALAPLATHVRDFAREVVDVARVLPARTELATREYEGRIVGRVDVAATLKRRLAGAPTRVVSQTPHRSFDRPENVLLVAVARRLAGLLSEIVRAQLASGSGWAAGFGDAAHSIQHALEATVLREVPELPLSALSHIHEQAARDAHHAAYPLAAQLHRALRDGIDADDPKRNARVLAEGALRPLEPERRFELAVLIELARALDEALDTLQPKRWRLCQALVEPNRHEVLDFTRDDGARIRFFYNQTKHLPTGPVADGLGHYLDRPGRYIPDISLVLQSARRARRTVIIEVKHSDDRKYLQDGYEEALIYRAEYAAELTGWPKAILVASGRVPGSPRRQDEVIAVGWDQWVPASVMEGLLEGM